MPEIIAHGIDVSKWNGAIDWDTVKPQIDFAIIRCGYGKNIESQDDPYWYTNANACRDRGIPFGSYLYAHATSVEAAISEAEHAIRLLNGYKLDYPVFYDMEDEDQVNLAPSLLFEIFDAWAKKIKEAGYYPAYYSNTNWKNNYLTDPRFEQYDHWVAAYSSSLKYTGPYTMWQYTSDGVVAGSSARTDMNYCYVDYPSIINPAPEPEPEEPDIPSEPEEPTIDPSVPLYENGGIKVETVPYTEPKLDTNQVFPHPVDHSSYSNVVLEDGTKRFGMIQSEMETFKTSITK